MYSNWLSIVPLSNERSLDSEFCANVLGDDNKMAAVKTVRWIIDFIN